MGVGKEHVEAVNIDRLFLRFINEYTTRGKYCCSYPNFLPFPHATRELFSLTPATAFLVLQELVTPYSSWCAAGVVLEWHAVTIHYTYGEY